MPCYDSETHERPVRLEQKVHRLTALLCGLCSKVESTHPELFEEDDALVEWWTKHKTQDARLEALKKKQAAQGFQSLTPREKDAVWFQNDISNRD